MNIFVAKLSFEVNDEDLKHLFAEYGEVTSARVITDKDTHRSKGYGFVEMTDDDSARNAIEALNDFEFNGRAIAVSEARPREERPRDGRSGGYRSDRNERRSYGNDRGGYDRKRY